MLLPVVIDVDAVDDESSEGARLEREDLLDRLLEHGLPHLRSADMKSFVTRLRSIPTSESQRWAEAMRFLRIRQVDVSGVQPSDLHPVFGKDNVLVVLATASAEGAMTRAGLEPPIAKVPRTQIEYAAASHVRQSVSIRKREEWAVEDLWPDTNLDQVAKQRFAPLFRTSRRISIVDRYAFDSFRKDGEKSGLSWLIRQLSKNSQTPCKVSLFSVHSPDRKAGRQTDDLDRWVGALEKQCSEMSGELHLFLGPDYVYKQVAHDRYLRIDDTRIIDLGKGLDTFAFGKVTQRSTFNYRTLKRNDQVAPYRELENQLRVGRDFLSFQRQLGAGFE